MPNVNNEIKAKNVRVLDSNKNMIGVLPTKDAIKMAESEGLDLVEVSPGADPPVCQIISFGKYKYNVQKKVKETKKKQKITTLKEVKIRHVIGEHDYIIKLRNIRKFIENKDKVKIIMFFKGREVDHIDLGMKLMERVKNDLQDVAKVDNESREGMRHLTMLLSAI